MPHADTDRLTPLGDAAVTSRRSFLVKAGLGSAATAWPGDAPASSPCQLVVPQPCVNPSFVTLARRTVMFGRVRFNLSQGRITINSVTHIVSTTAETVGSPGAIGFTPYWYLPSQESALGLEFYTAPVWFEVDFPTLNQIYYRWVDVTYRYRAGAVDEVRHEYLDLQGFQVT